MGYTSDNCKVLANHRGHMLLLHETYDHKPEYIIGSNFSDVLRHGALGYEYAEYSWDWGHYFFDIVEAVEYWKSEVLDN